MSTFNAEIELPPQSAATPGRVTRTLLRWMMRPAQVSAVKTLSPRFRLIDLEGDALKGVTWLPGQKVQVAMGSGLSSRTYTPMWWNADVGRTRLLVFLHGDGPGSRWAGDLREGETCQFFGPRRSLDLSGARGPVVLFGDETSFGLGAVLQDCSENVVMVFEVSDVLESRAVLAAVGLGRASVIERSAGDEHLAAIGADLSHHMAHGAQLVLTGKAQSIQSVSQALKKAGMASSSAMAKAYWSLGKTGLD